MTVTGSATGTVRWRPTPRHRNALLAAVIVAVAAVWVTSTRSGRSKAALADHHAEYATRGGEFVRPTDLERAADLDSYLLFAAIAFGLVVFSALVVAVAMWLPRLRLDDDGLWWGSAPWIRWRGPIPADDVVSIQPGVELKISGMGLPGGAAVAGAFRRTGMAEAHLVHLRSEAGLPMSRTGQMVLPEPPPQEARSLLVIRKPLIDANPDFMRRLRSWVTSRYV